MALIEQLMRTELVTAGPKDTVRQVAGQMNQNGVGAVLLVDDTGALCGLFSERDLLSRVVNAGLDPDATPVQSVATADPVTVEPNTHVRDCAALIRERGCRHLPVVRGRKPVGILSARDLLSSVVQGLEAFIDQARYEQDLEDGQDPYDHVGGSYSK
jgi:CBS domain-containing protein